MEREGEKGRGRDAWGVSEQGYRARMREKGAPGNCNKREEVCILSPMGVFANLTSDGGTDRDGNWTQVGVWAGEGVESSSIKGMRGAPSMPVMGTETVSVLGCGPGRVAGFERRRNVSPKSQSIRYTIESTCEAQRLPPGRACIFFLPSTVQYCICARYTFGRGARTSTDNNAGQKSRILISNLFKIEISEL